MQRCTSRRSTCIAKIAWTRRPTTWPPSKTTRARAPARSRHALDVTQKPRPGSLCATSGTIACVWPFDETHHALGRLHLARNDTAPKWTFGAVIVVRTCWPGRGLASLLGLLRRFQPLPAPRPSTGASIHPAATRAAMMIALASSAFSAEASRECPPDAYARR